MREADTQLEKKTSIFCGILSSIDRDTEKHPPSGSRAGTRARIRRSRHRCIDRGARVPMLDRSEISPADRVFDVVQRLLAERAIHGSIRAEDDLRQAGLSSLDMVHLVLSIEAEFDLRIPDTGITPANFRSIATISHLVGGLLGDR
jgi:acyl carrier protein